MAKNKKQPLLEGSLKYLIELNDRNLIALAIVMLMDGYASGSGKLNTNSASTFRIQSLVDADENIIAFEMMLYSYKQLIVKKDKAKGQLIDLTLDLTSGLAEYQSRPTESIVVEYISKVRNILEQWYHDPKRIDTIVSLLTKIYKKQIVILEELLKASTTAINQITNFNLILNSQIVTMKNLAKNAEEQKKCISRTGGSDVGKHMFITEIDKNKQQINDVTKLEQFAIGKILPTLIKKLKHDQEIFYSKHRFMEEEFKIFLKEHQALMQESAYSEASAANIYDLLKRIQYDIVREIEFGGYNV